MGLQFDAKTGLPLQLYCGAWEKPAGHLQGIAMDDEGRYMYYSFTDRLIKADMRTGEIVGSVTGLLAGGIYGGGAHMGCLAYHDGKVYGSLEYKAAEKFYVAVFDCAAITRMDMDYKTPGVMTTMYMDEVVRDYVCELSAGEHNNAPDSMGHRFGCSGIDGITFGPVPGEADKGVRMLLSYGIYSNPQRQDNDYQVVLAFDPKDFAAEPFDQNHPQILCLHRQHHLWRAEPGIRPRHRRLLDDRVRGQKAAVSQRPGLSGGRRGRARVADAATGGRSRICRHARRGACPQARGRAA